MADVYVNQGYTDIPLRAPQTVADSYLDAISQMSSDLQKRHASDPRRLLAEIAALATKAVVAVEEQARIPQGDDTFTATDKVLMEVNATRMLQDQQWGGPEHDDQHSLDEWRDLIYKYNQRGVRLGSNPRANLLHVAALAVAAIESFDRLTQKNPPIATDGQ